MRLSAVIITKNETDTIERCIRSVSFADEIIVVDAESSDDTVAKAQHLSAKTFVRPWPGYGPQKNFGLKTAQGEWVLFIDADEEVSPELAAEIQKTINASNGLSFYWLKIITVFLNRPLRHLAGHNPRLFRKSAGRWTNDLVHEQVETLEGKRIRLHDNLSQIFNPPLLHHSHTTIDSYLHSMHTYTTLDANQMKKTGRHRSGRPIKDTFLLPLHLTLRQFVKLYFYRHGWRDGYAGLIWSLLSAYYEWEMGRKFKMNSVK